MRRAATAPTKVQADPSGSGTLTGYTNWAEFGQGIGAGEDIWEGVMASPGGAAAHTWPSCHLIRDR